MTVGEFQMRCNDFASIRHAPAHIFADITGLSASKADGNVFRIPDTQWHSVVCATSVKIGQMIHVYRHGIGCIHGPAFT
jgi:hypothetical protein